MYSIEASKIYATMFDSLLIFNKNSELCELAEEKTPPLKGPSLYEKCQDLHLLISKYAKAEISHLGSLLKNKIKLWNDCLDSELYDCLQGNKSIIPLREIADLISVGKKTDIIRVKILQEKIENIDLSEGLNRLDLLIYRILNAKINCPIQNNNAHHPFFFHQDISSKFNFMNKARYYLYSQQHKDNENIISISNSEDVIASLNNNDLLTKFSSIDSIVDIKNISQYLTDQQSSFLIYHFFKNEQSWKFPIFLSNLSFNTFNALLLQLEDEILLKINSDLRGRPDLTSDWINFHSLHILQTFMEGCNAVKIEIDYLAKQFRCEIRWNDITNQHLLAIQNLDDICRLNLHAVKRLSRLLDGIASNPNFIIGIEELIQEYEHFIERLNNTPTRPEIGGGIFNIIVLSVFGDEIESSQKEAEIIQEILDQDTFHALGLWNLHYPDDYREIGLLGDLTDEEYAALLQDPETPHKINPMNANRLLALNLKKLGMETIEDLVQKRIFNHILLKEFLQRKDVQNVLNNSEIPLFEFLKDWNLQEDQLASIQQLGWHVSEDLRKQKLFTPAMLKRHLSLLH